MESKTAAAAACIRFDGELQAYLEGDARPFVATHARACPACAGVLADLEAIRQAARNLPPEEPAGLVWSRVREKLAAEEARAAAPCAQFDAQLQPFLEGETRPFVAAHDGAV